MCSALQAEARNAQLENLFDQNNDAILELKTAHAVALKVQVGAAGGAPGLRSARGGPCTACGWSRCPGPSKQDRPAGAPCCLFPFVQEVGEAKAVAARQAEENAQLLSHNQTLSNEAAQLREDLEQVWGWCA